LFHWMSILKFWFTNWTCSVWHTLKFFDQHNCGSKSKTSKTRVGVRSLIHNTSGVEGCAGTPKWRLSEWQASQLFTQTCTNQTTSWLVCN
jgi:hypothetical protein